MPEEDTTDFWWATLEEAENGLKQVEELLTDSTLSDEERNDLTSADLDYREARRLAQKQLGLTSR